MEMINRTNEGLCLWGGVGWGAVGTTSTYGCGVWGVDREEKRGRDRK
jgi:hypothetical protein